MPSQECMQTPTRMVSAQNPPASSCHEALDSASASACRGFNPALMFAPACAAVALAGFASALSITSAHYAGFIERTDWVSSLALISGIALLVACLVHFQNGNTLHATACGIYGSYWLGTSLQLISATAAAVAKAATLHGAPDTDPHEGVLHHLDATFTNLRIPLAIFTLYCMLAAHQLAKRYVLVYALFELQLVCLIAGSLSGDTKAMKAGGWFGLASSALAYYLSAHYLLKPFFTLPISWSISCRGAVSASPAVTASSSSGFQERLVASESHAQLVSLEMSQNHGHADKASATMSVAAAESTDIESQDMPMSANSSTRRAVKLHTNKSGSVHMAAHLGRRLSTMKVTPNPDSCAVSVVPSAIKVSS